ncbi:MAG: cbb3-type cytochrome c oxidase subunit 3 [Rhodospirillaceae bacterium]|jgi:cytochrome c oxidase cbb3-type subunit IV|nr:cbb3-type cytochrome c oxidase subunit 3 [Rhodospirillaceae bacterium]MBT5242781.1 cbb3-type cytochrome c oxidase subunit 3 [Rhodospirillaceae bacterium]MBT5562752.1 cbb3-type cytochrome c oxidase subunit 3 [Rhodospirillaceae bacterium]MBT6243257.1 cbb3-type cytochrome c oxidase subunit 3 [Rhodospirillaceae bacterium]
MTLETLYELARSTWVIWMVMLFSGIVLWAFLPRNKERFEDDAKIIFKDESNGV